MDLKAADAVSFHDLLARNRTQRPNSSLPASQSHLLLPTHLRILMEQTSALIGTLAMFKRRHQVPVFSKIRETVEQHTRHSYAEHQLCQSLRIIPKGSVVPEWQKDKRRTLPHQLILNLTSFGSIPAIERHVKRYLTDFVKGFHSQFLLERGEVVTDVREWHCDFNLDAVPQIRPITLPRPEIEQQHSITDVLRVDTDKTVKARVMMETPITVPKSCANLSSYFAVAKAVQERAAQKEGLSEIINEKRNTELLKMADVLHTIFRCKGKASLLMKDVLWSVQKAEPFRETDPRRQEEIVAEIIAKSDGFWKRVELRGAVYVQMEASASRTYQMVKGAIVRAVMGAGPVVCP